MTLRSVTDPQAFLSALHEELRTKTYRPQPVKRVYLARLRDRVRELTGPRWGWKPAPALIGEVTRYLRGWDQYFRHGYPATTYHVVNGYVQERLVHHLCRRSQRRYRPPADQTWYAHLQSQGLRLLSAK